MRKIAILGLLCDSMITSSRAPSKPVNQNPSEEADKLLEYINGISGKKTHSGQHFAPLIGSDGLPNRQQLLSFLRIPYN
jgi:hypothetical protein